MSQRNLTEEVKIDKEKVHVFERENNNTIMEMINYVIENYKGKIEFSQKNIIIKVFPRINIISLVTALLDLIITLY